MGNAGIFIIYFWILGICQKGKANGLESSLRFRNLEWHFYSIPGTQLVFSECTNVFYNSFSIHTNGWDLSISSDLQFKKRIKVHSVPVSMRLCSLMFLYYIDGLKRLSHSQLFVISAHAHLSGIFSLPSDLVLFLLNCFLYIKKSHTR